MRTFLKVLSLCALISGPSAWAGEAGSENDAAQQEPAARSYVYLKCPSTSLELDSKSLMDDLDGFYGISYQINLAGQKSLTESCSFIVTETEGFLENASVYIADLKEGASVHPGEFYTALPVRTPEVSLKQAPSFSVVYEYAGPFAVYFNLEKREFFVTPLIFIP